MLEGPDGGIGNDRLPPFGLRLRNLTRLETLSLLGCASNALAGRFLGPCGKCPTVPHPIKTMKLPLHTMC